MAFSILIPTWNNLEYLKHCLASIEKNSDLKHQIIVIANEGKDGTAEWLQQNKIEHIHHKINVGICTALNSTAELIKEKYIVYLNDDMYVLPHWDTILMEEVNKLETDSFMLSGTMIEPRDTGNKCVLVQDFGDDLSTFNEKELVEWNNTAIKEDWSGASWPPVLIPTDLWKKVGGMSEEFSPGMYSDPDLSMKLWQEGVRIFKGVGASRVYHFGSKSTRKLGKNVGRQIFLKKWGVTSNYFYKKFLKMGEKYAGGLPDFTPSVLAKITHLIKQILLVHNCTSK